MTTPNIRERVLEGYEPVRFGEVNGEKMIRGDRKVKAKSFEQMKLKVSYFYFNFF